MVVQQDGWPDGAPESGINYYRAGEVTLVIDPTPERLAEVRQTQDWSLIRGPLDQFFIDIQFPLHGDTWEHPSDRSARARDSQPLVLRRRRDPDVDAQNDRPFLLQTVTLSNAPQTDTHEVAVLRPPIDDVIRAVERINNNDPRWQAAKDQIAAEGFRIEAATPNWLSMPFHM